jgi:DNA-binding CsgD family transcriptional regulator/tetratricopeptide (TPR) repeat protein
MHASHLHGRSTVKNLETAAMLTLGLWPFWIRNGLYSEARQAQEYILDCRQFDGTALRAALLLDSALAGWSQSDFTRTRALATTAIGLYETLGNQAGVATGLYYMGESALADDPPRAVRLLGESIAVQRVFGQAQSLAVTLDGLAGALMYCGDLQGAKAAYTESQAIRSASSESRRWSNPLGWVALAEGDLDLAEQLLQEPLQPGQEPLSPYADASRFRLLGRVDLLRGNLGSATDFYHRALTIAARIGAQHEAGYCVAELAAVAQAAGEPERAARWLGFEEAQREQRRLGLTPDESDLRERAGEQALAALDECSFAAAWDEGRCMPVLAAFAEATEWHPAPSTPRTGTPPLTLRELEVLRLIALARTNQEIAAELYVSISTINTHVVNLIAKLGVKSRLAAVNAARDRGLLPS